MKAGALEKVSGGEVLQEGRTETRTRVTDKPKCGKCHNRLFDGRPVELDEAAFERHIATNDVPVVVDFRGALVGPCRMMAPEFEKAAAMLEPSARFARVHTEKAQRLEQRLNVRSNPTMALFRGGHETARQPVAMGAAQIASWVHVIA